MDYDIHELYVSMYEWVVNEEKKFRWCNMYKCIQSLNDYMYVNGKMRIKKKKKKKKLFNAKEKPTSVFASHGWWYTVFLNIPLE
jgi:hypothetical protein